MKRLCVRDKYRSVDEEFTNLYNIVMKSIVYNNIDYLADIRMIIYNIKDNVYKRCKDYV